jgi:AcrR family transcriptional regulator
MNHRRTHGGSPLARYRERILDAAERLFMAHGYEGTSMRQITGEAGVNLAAVNYHLGSKKALVQEVFRRRLDWLNDERMRVLNAMEAEADGKPLKPSQIVDGFFGTLLRMADDERRGGITFLRLLGRMLTDPRNSSGPFSPMNTARSLIATRKRCSRRCPTCRRPKSSGAFISCSAPPPTPLPVPTPCAW